MRTLICRTCRKPIALPSGAKQSPKQCKTCKTHKCFACGKTFVRVVPQDKSKGIARYCSKACYFDCVRKGTQAFKKARRDVSFELSQWFVDWEDQHSEARQQIDREALRNRCDICGSFAPAGYVVCSKACGKKWRGKKPCRSCGALVTSKLYGRTHCNECRRAAVKVTRQRVKKKLGNWRRRCRVYGGNFNPKCTRNKIYERDGYRCHVCGKQVLRKYECGNPLSATVDHHPVPLSKGGDHDWHNVRCCCSMCNTRKSDKWDGQLSLAFTFDG
jgi:LSD1 subclass zinc finger protein